MKKRLRKKLWLREFQRTGFAVGLYLTFPTDDTEASYPFWHKLIAFVEANGLYVEGAINDFSVFTNYNLIPQPAIKEADRYLIRDWLRQQPEARSKRFPCWASDDKLVSFFSLVVIKLLNTPLVGVFLCSTSRHA